MQQLSVAGLDVGGTNIRTIPSLSASIKNSTTRQMNKSKNQSKQQNLIDHYSRFNPSPLSIQKFLDFGTNACEQASFSFLRSELLVRLANILKEFQLVPEQLLQVASINQVQNLYLQSFDEMMKYAPSDKSTKASANSKQLDEFCQSLIKIRNRHSNVVKTLAQGVVHFKQQLQLTSSKHNLNLNSDSYMQSVHTIQYFLHRFYLNRISIRMLINQHAALFGEDLPMHSRHVGCIDPNCDVISVVNDAYEDARFLCEQYYLCAPDIEIQTVENMHRATDIPDIGLSGELLRNNATRNDNPFALVYVPSHLYHIAFELLKNAMRAVVEKHADESSLPNIKVQFVRGDEDLTIRIADQGGGISRSATSQLFDYMYSTAPKPVGSLQQIHTSSSPEEQQHDAEFFPDDPLYEEVPVFAGYGHGLPLSRLYARYLQGDLMLSSSEGYGTDARVYLKLLSSAANEVLPVFNKTSSRQYKSSSYVGMRDYQIGNSM